MGESTEHGMGNYIQASAASADAALTERIKSFARDIGFDVVGIARAEPFECDRAVLHERIARGHYSGLAWFTAARADISSDPRNLLPTARSIISVAMSYRPDPSRPDDRTPRLDGAPMSHADTSSHHDGAPPHYGNAVVSHDGAASYSDDDTPRGRISAYAWGADYHAVLKERMERVVDFIRQVGGPAQQTRALVDTARILDRAAARRAGVGWVGKHTNVISKAAGSWVLLGEILTELDLRPDAPLHTNCGRCDLCLRACPTGAIVAPYTIDNNRCISYLTIEHRGVIPRELRSLMGDWVFGCDVCQEVCPPNLRPGLPAHPALRPRADDGEPAGRPALIPLLEITPEEFARRFGRSPVKRARREGLQRNAAIALGNSGDCAAIPALAHALTVAAPLVRLHAAWALGRLAGRRIGVTQARAALQDALASEQDDAVRAEIQAALDEPATRDPAIPPSR